MFPIDKIFSNFPIFLLFYLTLQIPNDLAESLGMMAGIADKIPFAQEQACCVKETGHFNLQILSSKNFNAIFQDQL